MSREIRSDATCASAMPTKWATTKKKKKKKTKETRLRDLTRDGDKKTLESRNRRTVRLVDYEDRARFEKISLLSKPTYQPGKDGTP